MNTNAARPIDSTTRRPPSAGLSAPRTHAPFCVEDYVQLACTLRKSVRLTASHADGSAAEIVVYNGELWRVADNRGGGSAAFRRLLGRPCEVQVEHLSEADRGPRNVFSNWEQLLLLAAMENTPNDEGAAKDVTTRGEERRKTTAEGRASALQGPDAPASDARRAQPSDPDAEVRVSGVRLTGSRPESIPPIPPQRISQPSEEPSAVSSTPKQPSWRVVSGTAYAVKRLLTPESPSPQRRGQQSRYFRSMHKGMRDTLSEVSTAMAELRSRPERRQAFLAAGICACLAVLWLNFVQGEFRRLSGSPSTAAASVFR